MYDGYVSWPFNNNNVKTQISALWGEKNFINNGGNFGIGTPDPNVTLHVAGDILCEGMIMGNVEPPKKFTAGHAYEMGEDLTGKEGCALIMKAGKVFLSTSPKDKRIIGFLEKIFEGKSSLDNSFHNKLAAVIGLGDSKDWKITYEKDQSGNVIPIDDIHTIKGVNICHENGNIEIGDFLTTSSTPGYFMKQDDDLVHNYTAARCMEDIVFDSTGKKQNVYCIMMCG